MTENVSIDDWLAIIGNLPSDLKSIRKDVVYGGVREALLLVWLRLKSAPGDTLDLFEKVLDIEAGANDVHVRSSEPEFGLRDVPVIRDNLLETIKALAVNLRALETFLVGQYTGQPSVNPNTDWRIEWGEHVWFLVPFPRLAWKPEVPEPRGSFTRRGLTSLRILPTIVDGKPVRFHVADALVGPTPKSFGSVIFNELIYTSQKTPGKFLITAAEGAGVDDTIDNAVRLAHGSDCLVLTYPELTIDPTRLERIRQQLLTKPWLDDVAVFSAGAPVPRAPSLVLAGTWHTLLGEAYVNRLTVFSGNGECCMHYDKRKIYTDPKDGDEEIVPGKHVDILCYDRMLFAFAICLDFCKITGTTSAFETLDVDLVCVPSNGNSSTMSSHIEAARRLHILRNTRAHVVQQAEKPLDSKTGYVVDPDGNHTARSAESTLRAPGVHFWPPR